MAGPLGPRVQNGLTARGGCGSLLLHLPGHLYLFFSLLCVFTVRCIYCVGTWAIAVSPVLIADKTNTLFAEWALYYVA